MTSQQGRLPSPFSAAIRPCIQQSTLIAEAAQSFTSRLDKFCGLSCIERAYVPKLVECAEGDFAELAIHHRSADAVFAPFGDWPRSSARQS